MSRTTVAVLGSTGSIGTQTLEVLERVGEAFEVVALGAGDNVDLFETQVRKFRPHHYAMANEDSARVLCGRLGNPVASGDIAIADLAKSADIVVNAISGANGLRASLSALDAGARLALANKESCVMAGDLLNATLKKSSGTIIPVDSEHASLHMCLAANTSAGRAVNKVVITASGGPFRELPIEELDSVEPAQALAHPTWSMGNKITIDSATLMNKGLETIEAHVLFGFGYDEISVVVHPQSIVHCVVGFIDGTFLAAVAPPDMRISIAYALGAPDRVDWKPDPFDVSKMGSLDFEEVDNARFPALEIAVNAGREGGLAPCVLNAANEVAVGAFLDEQIRFTDIVRVVSAALEKPREGDVNSLEGVQACDAKARADARDEINQYARR